MLNRAWLFAIMLFFAAWSPSQSNGQFMMRGAAAGPMIFPPRAGSFYFGVAPPLPVAFAAYAAPPMPSVGFYVLPPVRALPEPSDRWLMPLNADDLLRGTVPGGPAHVAGDPRDRPGGDTEPPLPRLRVANEKAAARAQQFMAHGDASFRRQEFARAYDRYRKACESAPNLAEAYFRQALAQSAVGQFLPAVKTICRGLAIDARWPSSSFRLDQLYPNRAAKEAHLQRLALTAGDQPERAELMFLLGVEIYFDGQPARAATFLQQAAKLGFNKNLLRGFLNSALAAGQRRPGGEDL